MNRLKVNDAVKHKRDQTTRGIVVAISDDVYAVLWDRDWRSGRTFKYSRKQLVHIS